MRTNARDPGRIRSAKTVGRNPLRDEYSRTIAPAHVLAAESLTLERTRSDLVDQAYALTLAQGELMCQTAPARMPISAPATPSPA